MTNKILKLGDLLAGHCRIAEDGLRTSAGGDPTACCYHESTGKGANPGTLGNLWDQPAVTFSLLHHSLGLSKNPGFLLWIKTGRKHKDNHTSIAMAESTACTKHTLTAPMLLCACVAFLMMSAADS